MWAEGFSSPHLGIAHLGRDLSSCSAANSTHEKAPNSRGFFALPVAVFDVIPASDTDGVAWPTLSAPSERAKNGARAAHNPIALRLVGLVCFDANFSQQRVCSVIINIDLTTAPAGFPAGAAD